MLSPLRVIRPGVVGALTLALLTTLLLSLSSFERAAADGDTVCWDAAQNKFVYGCRDEGDGNDGEDGDGGGDDSGSEPPCDLSLVEGRGHPDATRYCEGENACWANIPSEAFPTPETWPEEPPTPDAIYTYKTCYGPDGSIVFNDWTWLVPDQPSVEELAREAYGELQAPEFELAFSPPQESVIFLDTWWWAEGASNENLTGTAALGVVAIAEPDRMEVDPGDGSGTITCGFVTSESDACTHLYERASDGEGYPARARLLYDVHFEQNGEPIEVAGVPDTFDTAWVEATVPVTEVQTNVIR